jgi:hypothetical protein
MEISSPHVDTRTIHVAPHLLLPHIFQMGALGIGSCLQLCISQYIMCRWMPSPQLDSEIGFVTFSEAAKLYMFSSDFLKLYLLTLKYL